MGTEVFRPQDCLLSQPKALRRIRRSPFAKPYPIAARIFVTRTVTILTRGHSLKGGNPKKGPELIIVPREVPARPASAPPPDVYAGSAVANSPSPRALPLPSFSTRKQESVDTSATRNLRRLLRLE